MAKEYAVSFELKSDATYQARYDSLMAQLRKGAGGFWDETTSFVLVRTDEAIDDFERRLYVGSSFDGSKDKILVIDHAASTAIARGVITMPHTLKGHFKHCTIK